ncbi:MAG: monomeric [FeFe] hydrogenase [Bacteroidales bacterium]|nr:monomeric [FeFe] hydrogenase [Bacteroidales bacterium]
MNKINVKICLGTTCYVMGASDLQMMKEFLPENLADKVLLCGSPCLDYCFEQEVNGKPPFVEINGKVLGEATIEKVTELIKKKWKMTFTNKAMLIRRELMKHFCDIVLNGKTYKAFDRIPYIMRLKNGDATRCCIYKDRAVLRYKIMAMLGIGFYEEEDELKRISEYLEEDNEADNDFDLTVVDEACSSCIKKNYVITNACKGCVARPCQVNCPKDAVLFRDGKAFIDASRCINCGMCMKACPYHAIIYQPVPCEEACPVNAIYKDDEGNERIDEERCILCGKCMVSCPFGAIVEKSSLLDVLNHIRNGEKLVAMVAPSIIGQYNNDIKTLKDGMKVLGFHDVIEVAVGAELTSREEAKELDEAVSQNRLLTTSCCPSYVELVERHIPKIRHNVSATPTPACFTSQRVKENYPDALQVFIGPCLAKKSEARKNPSIDYVLNFEELGAMFMSEKLDVSSQHNQRYSDEINNKARGFAFSEGVTASVLSFSKNNAIKNDFINGISKKEVRRLRKITKENLQFLEVMACEGGCAGGPSSIANERHIKKKHHQCMSSV